MKTLLLIDASALIHRFFHALPPLTAKTGEPIQGIYGLNSVLIKILREQKPDYAAAALDRPEATFRKEEFKEYKSQRPPTHPELISQIRKLPETFREYGIKTFEAPGFEADDIIGTLANTFENEPDLKIIVLSADLDMLQLVRDDHVVCETIKTGVSETIIYNEARVEEKYGLKPSQLPEYKALIGDVSDNIPGLSGVGPKTARELLKEFGNLKDIYENLGIIKSKTAEKLEGREEEARLYLKLATIKKDVPMEMPTLPEINLGFLDKDKLASYFEKMGFTSLARRL